MGNDRLTKFVADATPGAKGIDVPFFSSDVIPDISVAGTLFTYNIQISGGPAIIEITTDGQATWHSVNTGVAIGETSTFTAQELVDLGGAFNIRAKSAITLDRAIVRLV
jgi:hypothetical protein